MGSVASTPYDPLSDTSQVISSLVFGPNISRRLGYALGINILPPGRAFCTYKCAYCPLFPFLELVPSPEGVGGWPEHQEVAEALASSLCELSALRRLDALVVIGNGEPTLHPELPEVLRAVGEVRDLLAPEAELVVFTNSSLLWRDGVPEALSEADRVVAKLDAVEEGLWKTINRPHEGLPGLKTILSGLMRLREALPPGSKLVASVMLLKMGPEGKGNASEEHLRALSSFLSGLGPDEVHLETPPAPPGTLLRPLAREEVAEAALRLSDELGDDKVFILVGTTAPIPVRLLKASKSMGKEVFKSWAEIPEGALDLLVHGPGARTRLRILEALSGGKMNCNQVARALGISWWSAQRHLERLLEAGLIRTVAFGRRTLYALTPKGLSALLALRSGPVGHNLPTRLL